MVEKLQFATRDFEDKLTDLVDMYDLPWEIKRVVISGIYSKVTRQADEAIREELLMVQEQSKEEPVDAEIVFEDKLGELPE